PVFSCRPEKSTHWRRRWHCSLRSTSLDGPRFHGWLATGRSGATDRRLWQRRIGGSSSGWSVPAGRDLDEPCLVVLSDHAAKPLLDQALEPCVAVLAAVHRASPEIKHKVDVQSFERGAHRGIALPLV